MTYLAYWAGRFRASTPEGVERNIERARIWAMAVNRTGRVQVVLPHNASTGIEASLTEEQWVDFTRELSRRCDGMIMDPEYASSPGSVGEYEQAQRDGLPVVVAQSLAKIETSVRELVREIEHVEAMKRAAKVALPKDES